MFPVSNIFEMCNAATSLDWRPAVFRPGRLAGGIRGLSKILMKHASYELGSYQGIVTDAADFARRDDMRELYYSSSTIHRRGVGYSRFRLLAYEVHR
jgi:hypothetical protein